ncbi:putative colanic acid biosysnthesis UDP-glucose lipid carrier transferase [Billgrantia desiderata]|nr:putative colanic acid biosysnthesis UDP-glucose lipid carrier transferase [Halomonas desiderata]
MRNSGIAMRDPVSLIGPWVDFLLVVLVGLGVHRLRFGIWQLDMQYGIALLAIAALVTLACSMNGAYQHWRSFSFPQVLMHLLVVWLGVALVVMSFLFLAHVADRYSRLWVGFTLLGSFLLSVAARVLAYQIVKALYRQGRLRRGVFLVGPQGHVLDVGKDMRRYASEGFSIAGVHRLRDTLDEEALEALVSRVERSGAREVWICIPLERGHEAQRIFRALQQLMMDVRLMPGLKDMRLLNHRASQVAGRYALDLSVSPMAGLAPVIKRLEDIVLGALIGVLILPVCLVLAVIVKLSSPGPVLFKQYRTGINGKRFKVYKFRSMEMHDEPEGQVTQAKRDDKRVTKVGAFMRRTSLDELPQFYNVLQGRMSIVGPRPHALSHNDHYRELVESYMRRHKVKPGITGWAQVNGLRGETDTLEKMEQRVEHDLWYIDNWSLGLDLKIIFLTIFKGFSGSNAY